MLKSARKSGNFELKNINGGEGEGEGEEEGKNEYMI